MKNKGEILGRLLRLAEYYRIELTETQQMTYMKSLDRYEDDRIIDSINRSISERSRERCHWFPMIHELEDLMSGASDGPYYAFGQVMENHGNREWRRNCSDIILDTVQALGGWDAFYNIDTRYIGLMNDRFVKAYKEISQRGSIKKALPVAEGKKEFEITQPEIKALLDKTLEKMGG